MRTFRHNWRPAFTLVELLVVLALIGVLAGLAIYFVPSFQTSERAARGGADLQQILNTARQRALRDKAPRGVRIVFENIDIATNPADPIIQATKCQFIEQPDDLGGGRYWNGTQFTSLTLQTGAPDAQGRYSQLTVNGADFNDGSVQAGEYLEINGSGLVHFIAGVPPAPPTNKLTLAFGLQYPITTATPSFRIIRKPRVVGDELFELPRTVVIDAATNANYNIPLPIEMPVPPNGHLDILFSPNGSVLSPNAADRIYFWVRSTDEDAQYAVPQKYFLGEPTLIVVYVNSGLVAAYPVNSGNPANPYDLVK